MTKEVCKLWVNFPWHSGGPEVWMGRVVRRHLLQIHPSSPHLPPKVPPMQQDSAEAPSLPCSLIGADHILGWGGQQGSGVKMPSRDELLASPKITSNLRHLRGHLVQLPIVQIGRLRWQTAVQSNKEP